MSTRPARIRRPTEKIRDPNNCGELELTYQHEAQSLAHAEAVHEHNPVTASSNAKKRVGFNTLNPANSATSSSRVPTQPAPIFPSSPVLAPPSSPPPIPPSSPITISDNEDDGDSGSEEIEIVRHRKRKLFVHDDSSSSESGSSEVGGPKEDAVPRTQSKIKQKKRPRKQRKESTPEPVDAEGFLKDVHVQPIKKVAPIPDQRCRDLDHFFGTRVQRISPSGGLKDHRACKLCPKDKGVPSYLVADTSTLRRHLEARHIGQYRKWALDNDFESKLPKDVNKRKVAKQQEEERQQTLHPHLKALPPAEQKLRYTAKVFREAAVEWLIATDQPLGALEHPKLKRVLELAAASTNGIEIPSRKLCRQTVMQMFNEQMDALKKKLNSDVVKCDINLTCDAWQASNADGYLAVTGHWIEDTPQGWELQSALLGFVQMNNAHNGVRLGQALFKITDRLGIAHKILKVTCDNASSNGTMLHEFSFRLKTKLNRDWDARSGRINCLGHVINLATQALLKAYSKTPHFDPADPEKHIPAEHVSSESDEPVRDEVGLVRAIAVKARSSPQRKEKYRTIQADAGVKIPRQMVLDMEIRWSSTYVMLHRAEEDKMFVDTFVDELARKASTLTKRRELDSLKLTEAEWSRVSLFIRLLSHADNEQQAFSSETEPCLYHVIPALERLHKVWSSRAEKWEYRHFANALQAGIDKIAEYYDKTGNSDAYVVSLFLHPEVKDAHFKRHWSDDLQKEARNLMESIYAKYYKRIYGTSGKPTAPATRKKPSRATKLLRAVSDDESDSDRSYSVPHSNPAKPWLESFNSYLNTTEFLPEGMSVVRWWGLNATRYEVWAAIARDYLSIMASSVSSERAFSQGGITVSKRRSRLKGDIVEGLQVMKCMILKDLIFRAPEPSALTEESDGVGGQTDSEDIDDEQAQPPAWDMLLLEEEFSDID